MPAPVVIYLRGIPEGHRGAAARLYLEAFGGKFARVVPDKPSQLKVLERGLRLEYGIAALADGDLVGLAGYATRDGALTDGISWRALVAVLGVLRGTLAAVFLVLFIRPRKPGQLLMDGIAVDARMRGQGVGAGLLEEIVKVAREHRLASVRLDVIDTNPRARQLYLRSGFKVTRVRRFEWLRGLLGFGAAETMQRVVG